MNGIRARKIIENFHAVISANNSHPAPRPINIMKSENLNDITDLKFSTLLKKQINTLINLIIKIKDNLFKKFF